MKGALTLIELIVAIVIIAIAVLAIPGVFMQGTNTLQGSALIEPVFYLDRTMGAILTYRWDENSMVGEENKTHILDVSNLADGELNRTSPSSITRIGNFNIDDRRNYFTSITYASYPVGADTSENSFANFDDIDDFNGSKMQIRKQSGEFMSDFDIYTKVFYIDDHADYNVSELNVTISTTPITHSSNIKMIELRVTRPNSTKTIAIFRGLSCNIGEPDLLSKDVL